jgi:hypothetical protein
LYSFWTILTTRGLCYAKEAKAEDVPRQRVLPACRLWQQILLTGMQVAVTVGRADSIQSAYPPAPAATGAVDPEIDRSIAI